MLATAVASFYFSGSSATFIHHHHSSVNKKTTNHPIFLLQKYPSSSSSNKPMMIRSTATPALTSPPSPSSSSSSSSDSTTERSSSSSSSAGGIVGVIGDRDMCATRLALLGLRSLLHRRGQGGAAAIASSNLQTLHSSSQLLLDQHPYQADPPLISSLNIAAIFPGSSAVGHVSNHPNLTIASSIESGLALAFTGKLLPPPPDRHQRQGGESCSTDAQYIIRLIEEENSEEPPSPLVARVIRACESLRGSYSFVLLSASEGKLIAVRDPHGFHPLVMGIRRRIQPVGDLPSLRVPLDEMVAFASESWALQFMETAYEREVKPGEVIVVDENDDTTTITTLCLVPRAAGAAAVAEKRQGKEKIDDEAKPKPCIVELLHVAGPYSIAYGSVAVCDARILLGEVLARECPVPDADVTLPVLHAAWFSAAAFAIASGIPCNEGLVSSLDVHGTLKLETIPGVVKGKRVVVVDYSMSGWHLMPKIVSMIKNTGAIEVHVRIASPLVVGPCYYGVDIKVDTRFDKLISSDVMDHIEALRREIGCNSLAFLPLDALKELLKDAVPTFCDACFSRDYPLLPPKGE